MQVKAFILTLSKVMMLDIYQLSLFIKSDFKHHTSVSNHLSLKTHLTSSIDSSSLPVKLLSFIKLHQVSLSFIELHQALSSFIELHQASSSFIELHQAGSNFLSIQSPEYDK